jgi:hypothetical protein
MPEVQLDAFGLQLLESAELMQSTINHMRSYWATQPDSRKKARDLRMLDRCERRAEELVRDACR